MYVGAADPSGIASFAAQTKTSPTIAADYLPSNDGWTGMDGAGGSLNWMTGAWKGTGYRLSLGVPMIPTNSSGTAAGTLAQGATGAYNSYFVTLAQTLVAAGEANAYLRIGWEFDGSWTTWNATTASAEATYAAYFQQIVTAMRSVPGEHFQFVWNPDATAFTESGYSVEAAYPGNAYVDVIGLDAYDQSWATPQTPANAWSSTLLPALTAAQKFASSEGKPLAFTEWGVIIRSDGHGLGDDPNYVNQMISWMENRHERRRLRVLLRLRRDRAELADHRGIVPQQPGRLRVRPGLTVARSVRHPIEPLSGPRSAPGRPQPRTAIRQPCRNGDRSNVRRPRADAGETGIVPPLCRAPRAL